MIDGTWVIVCFREPGGGFFPKVRGPKVGGIRCFPISINLRSATIGQPGHHGSTTTMTICCIAYGQVQALKYHLSKIHSGGVVKLSDGSKVPAPMLYRAWTSSQLRLESSCPTQRPAPSPGAALAKITPGLSSSTVLVFRMG